MKAFRFHNLIGKLIVESNAGHLAVCIDKSTFSHPLENDGCVILDVHAAEVRTYPVLDGDGYTEINKDGTERMRTSVVLYGDMHAPGKT
jgi:uncharacterized protein YtpQ (UPF0354 family)